MDYDELLRSFLKMSIKYDCVEKYLLGTEGFHVKENPGDRFSPHAFDYAVKIYNEVNVEEPSLNLPQKYVQALEKALSKKEVDGIDVYCIFKCLFAQLNLEHKKESSFNISLDEKIRLLNLLRQKIDLVKELLINCDYAEGELYQDGLYGFINKKNDDFSKQTGSKLL